MERRALLAIILSLLIVVGYQELVLKQWAPPPAETPGAETAPPTIAPAAPSALPPPAAVEARPSTVAAVEGRDVVVDTDLYRATFTTAGARLKSFQLKDFRSSVAPDSPPLEMVHEATAGELPLGILLRGSQSSADDAAVEYQVDRERLALTADATGTITFTGGLEGAKLTKQFQFTGNRYLLGAEVQVENPRPEFTEFGIAWNRDVDLTAHPGREVLFDAVVALQAGKLQQEVFSGLEAGKILENNVGWVGFSGKYFLTAMALPNGAEAGGAPNKARLWLKQRGELVQTHLLLPANQFATHLDVYVGPKAIDVLEAAGHSLRRAVDLGWFSFVAIPLLQVLKLSHGITGNYGLDIVLLTVAIKILFIPLTQRSFASMREMQKLQPQMAKIREEFKDDSERMNKEIMELYRRHKVNPLGGCLPMILQMPVFIGLYSALGSAIELRHAPFVAWINDLSAPDRLGTMQLPFIDGAGFPVLTLFMGASMFVQQWMTPAAGDPAQQRVMMIMPLMFTFMFINFPSGLTLYWLVNNILTIAQQYAMTRPGKASQAADK